MTRTTRRGFRSGLSCSATRSHSRTYTLNEDTQPVIRAIGVSHTACKDEFRQNIRSHSWSVFSFFIIVAIASVRIVATGFDIFGFAIYIRVAACTLVCYAAPIKHVFSPILSGVPSHQREWTKDGGGPHAAVAIVLSPAFGPVGLLRRVVASLPRSPPWYITACKLKLSPGFHVGYRRNRFVVFMNYVIHEFICIHLHFFVI